MKKLVALLAVAIMSVAMVGCGSQGNASQDAQESVTESSTAEETTTDETSSDEDAAGNTTLVVYFSNTGNTRNIAEIIAEGLSADTYEIVAEEPYTEEDLDWNDSNSRSTLEMNDSSARPAISGSVENMDQYTTVYIGYPIWWGEAPRILDTFVESYDFDGKTVIPFVTSSSSGIGSSAKNLEDLAGAGTWMDGERFSGGEDKDTVMEWVNQF